MGTPEAATRTPAAASSATTPASSDSDSEELPEEAPTPGDWKSYGRVLCRLAGDPFTRLLSVVEQGLQLEADGDIDSEEESHEDFSSDYW